MKWQLWNKHGKCPENSPTGKRSSAFSKRLYATSGSQSSTMQKFGTNTLPPTKEIQFYQMQNSRKMLNACSQKRKFQSARILRRSYPIQGLARRTASKAWIGCTDWTKLWCSRLDQWSAGRCWTASDEQKKIFKLFFFSSLDNSDNVWNQQRTQVFLLPTEILLQKKPYLSVAIVSYSRHGCMCPNLHGWHRQCDNVSQWDGVAIEEMWKMVQPDRNWGKSHNHLAEIDAHNHTHRKIVSHFFHNS